MVLSILSIPNVNTLAKNVLSKQAHVTCKPYANFQLSNKILTNPISVSTITWLCKGISRIIQRGNRIQEYHIEMQDLGIFLLEITKDWI